MCLASRISKIFSEDDTILRHDELAVSVFDNSDFPESYCSTMPGMHFSRPQSSTISPGVYAVIQSSIMRLALGWPALGVPVVNNLQDPGVVLDEKKYMAFSISEGALIVRGASQDELLSLCYQACYEIALARNDYTDNSQCHGFAGQEPCGGEKIYDRFECDLHDRWEIDGTLGPSCDPCDVREPLLETEYADDLLNYADDFHKWLEPEFEFSDSYESTSPSSLISPLSPMLSPLVPSPRSTFSLVSPTSLDTRLPPEGGVDALPAMIASLREINSEGSINADPIAEYVSENIRSEGIPFSELELMLLSQQLNTDNPAQLEASPAKLNEGPLSLQVPTWHSEALTVRRSKRAARKPAPYQQPEFTHPSPSPSCSTFSDLSSLPPSRQASPLSLETDAEYDVQSESGDEEEPKKPRPQQKRVKGSKKRFHCTFCPESFTREADVDRHHKSCILNPAREPRRNCDYCDKKLPVRDDAKERHWKSNSCQSQAIRRGILPGSLDYA